MATPVKCTCAILAAIRSAPAPVWGAAMILNEYNAVADHKYLGGSDYSDALNLVNPVQEDSHFGTVPGMLNGRIEGNGGDWLELVVITDHLNIQGWQLWWAETDATNTNGGDLWYGDAHVEQGIITFSSTAAIWSDLRKGTIITISEKSAVGVDTDWVGADLNFTHNVPPGDVDVTIPLQTDISYNPILYAANEDWWIHVSTSYEQAGGAYLVYTDSNVVGYGPGDFSVSEDDWQLTIVDDSGGVIFGPVGEDILDFGATGINDREAGRLEADPSGGVGNGGFHDATSTTFGQPNAWDLQVQSFYDLRVPEPMTMLLLAAGVPLALKRGRSRR